MEEPLVSILISSYNHEKYVEQCLSSIVNQTYKNIELIILNDGSIDQTHNKIKEMEYLLKPRFRRFIYINKVREGVTKNLNQAIAISQGQYIMTFASDDVMLPWRVELQVKYLQSHPDYEVVYTDGYRIFSDGFIDMYKTYDPVYRFSTHMEFKEGELLDYILENLFNKPTPTICAKRECYEKIGSLDESMDSEDPDLYIRMAKVSKIGYIKQILTIHRMHNHNAGLQANIILPLFDRMRSKYGNSNILTFNQKQKLFHSLDQFLSRSNLV